MAPRTPKTPEAEQASSTDQTPPPVDLALDATRPPQPRPPQGIDFRFSETGDARKDLHPRWKHVKMLDPACLVVDGKDPYLALPIDGNPAKVRIRRIAAEEAARRLSCDPATGGQSIYRLATDAEVEQAEREHAERKANKGQPKQ